MKQTLLDLMRMSRICRMVLATCLGSFILVIFYFQSMFQPGRTSLCVLCGRMVIVSGGRYSRVSVLNQRADTLYKHPYINTGVQLTYIHPSVSVQNCCLYGCDL
ncbi:hypothetical protein PO909_028689 [Leuciscus waleckii]